MCGLQISGKVFSKSDGYTFAIYQMQPFDTFVSSQWCLWLGHSLSQPNSSSFSNTQERKPVTNSRDTQELLPDAGQEMLRIFHSHPARTSLLQDFAFYEVISSVYRNSNPRISCALCQLQAMQKMQSDSASSSSSPPPQAQNILAQSPQPQNTTLSQMPQNGFAMPQNPSNMGFPGQHLQMPQMNPMMGMQMNIPLAAPYGIQTPTLHQTVMRHASPAPPGAAMQNFASMGGTPQF